MSRTLYVTDLDGTLLGPDSQLSAESARMLNEAVSLGALVTVATARTPATVSNLLKDVDFRLPLIVMTGGALWNKSTGCYSDVQFFSPSQVEEIIKAYGSQAEGGAFLYTLPAGPNGKDIFEIYHIGPLNAVEKEFMQERIDSPFKRFYVPESGVSSLPESINDAVLFFGMQPVSVARSIYDRLGEIEDINPMIYHDWHGDEIAEIEAFPPTTTKAQAIRRLAGEVGADRVVVYGDNVNDLSMFRVADLGIAVENAVPEVKSAAGMVIGSNRDNAVARHILNDFRSSL